MARHAKTLTIVDQAYEILEAYHPMTVRQVYYQLVSRQVIKNSRSEYQAVSNALVSARLEGVILWEWIEDRLRRPRHVQMWDDLPDFAETARRAYRRDVWTYNLPPDLAKTTDTRRNAFVAKNGDVSVELDALPADVLRSRLTDEVGAYMDLEALASVRTQEAQERAQLVEALQIIGG